MCVCSLQHSRSSSTGNLLEREMALPTPDYGMPTRFLTQTQSTQHSRQRPYSVTMPGFSQVSYAHTYTEKYKCMQIRLRFTETFY